MRAHESETVKQEDITVLSGQENIAALENAGAGEDLWVLERGGVGNGVESVSAVSVAELDEVTDEGEVVDGIPLALERSGQDRESDTVKVNVVSQLCRLYTTGLR